MTQSLPQLQKSREQTIDTLRESFTNDVLDVEEYERRVDLALQASTLPDLETLVQDLTPIPTSASLATTDSAPQEGRIISILSTNSRQHNWIVPRQLKVLTLLGETKLDFREAQFSPEGTDVFITSVLGDVKILVPRQLRVEVLGMGILGEFIDFRLALDQTAEEVPVMRIHGVAVLAEVAVNKRFPGETAWQAWKRRRREKRERQRSQA